MTALAWSGCCATAPGLRFLVERLRKAGSTLVYRCAKQHSEPGGDRRAGTELAVQGGGDGSGAGRTFAAGQGASRASHCGIRCAHPVRTCAFQTLTGVQVNYLWAVLIARIYEELPLLCPLCGGQMRIIAFITHSADIRQMLVSLGLQAQPPNITPARGPPLWEDCDAQVDEAAQVEPDWDLTA